MAEQMATELADRGQIDPFPHQIVNVFSVDVEDYFHPSELAGDLHRWSAYPPRVEIGVEFLLSALAEHKVRGTFFVLGWVAMRHARMIHRIAQAGHEIGCHSYAHSLVYNLTPTEFEQDTIVAVKAIEDASGVTPRMYRAPSYSITSKNLWALDVLASCGFTHDSSIYPIVHDRYGIPGFPRHARQIKTASGDIIEVPIATVRLAHDQIAPVGGGAYMRLFPYRYTAAGVRRINIRERQPACLYLHPWELDPGQPRLAPNWISHLRTYTGLRYMRSKMSRLLRDFSFSTLTSVYPSTCPLPVVADVVQFQRLFQVPNSASRHEKQRNFQAESLACRAGRASDDRIY